MISGSSARTRRRVQHLFTHILVLVAAVAVGFPFVYMVLTSLKSISEVYTVPMVWVPAEPQWANYVAAWSGVHSPRYMLNTLHLRRRPDDC